VLVAGLECHHPEPSGQTSGSKGPNDGKNHRLP
jgi:hypothetical protein